MPRRVSQNSMRRLGAARGGGAAERLHASCRDVVAGAEV
jgi:hypothetical protein